MVFNSGESHKKLLVCNNQVSIHQKHLSILANETYKAIVNNSLKFMYSYIPFKVIPCEVRGGLKPLLARSTYFDTNSIHLNASLFWNGPRSSLKKVN